jgi:SAM-dependent methyltransferase
MTEQQVGREAQYEMFADEFFRHAENGLYNAHYDRPACLALLGDVAGRTVLDAACGPGLYARELLARGARVIGFDQSPRMAELAAQQAPGGEFRVHDLSDPLTWLPDGSVDLALCALAIEYIDDRVSALRELRRVLRPDGALVLSRMHPTSDWLRGDGGYFDVRVVEETWQRGRWHVRYWLAPLETTCAEIAEAGFVIERLVEPRPTPRGAEVDPAHYAELTEQPGFLAFRLRPSPF